MADFFFSILIYECFCGKIRSIKFNRGGIFILSDMISFAYESGKTSFIHDIEHNLISEMRCKHVLSLDSEKAERLYGYSCDIGYPQAMWGYGESLDQDPARNRIVQLGRIQRYIYERFVHPVRIVVDEKGVLWIDNLHNAIAHELCRYDCRISNIPYYIVERDERYIWHITDPYGLVHLGKVAGILKSSANRLGRVDDAVRSVKYTIGEFIQDNRLYFEEVTLDCKSMFQIEYCKAVDRIIK